MRLWVVSLVLVLAPGLMATAQERPVWLQIETHASLAGAEAGLRRYDGVVDHVNGFTNSAGWYVIAVGPFSEPDARTAINRLLANGQIPADAFLVDGATYRQQFWPQDAVFGQNILVAPPSGEPGDQVAEIATDVLPAPSLAEEAPVEDIELTQAVTPAEPEILEETPAQARRSEAQLDRPSREAIQVALQWEGFYTQAIDGAFGPGTRRAMAAYQRARGFPETGVLTTRQRTQLVDEYKALLQGLGMETVRNSDAGIELAMPMGLVAFDSFDPPFVKYDGSQGVQVLLISQEGTAATLAGLYDIMQTLETVRINGPRERSTSSFTLTGQNAEISSHTYAAQANGHVKGFTLIWPAGDQKRFDRVVREMRESFEPIEGVLDDTLGAPEGEQRIDLLAGLEIRRPEKSRSGFYVDNTGSVLTTLEVALECRRLTIDEEYEAEIAATAPSLGLALLKPQSELRPISFARFQAREPRIRSEVAVSGYSYEGVLGAPTLTFGTLEDVRGLDGEESVQRLSIAPQPGDAGGPVFDGTGAVVGVLLSREEGTQKLPEDVRFAANVPALASLLSDNGVAPSASEVETALAPEDLTVLAADMTVLVSCWN